MVLTNMSLSDSTDTLLGNTLCVGLNPISLSLD